MKVVLIYRQPRTGAYSIEELFQAVGGELRKYSDVIEYICGSRWSLLKDVWQLRRMKADVYHLTGDINYLVLFLPLKKAILTVHDIGHFLYGLTGWKRHFYKLVWLVFPINCVHFVSSVSKETKDNIVKHLGVDEKSIIVIENCYSEIFKYVPLSFNYACPVILQVGTKHYKNVPRLIEALKGIKCRLVLIGQLDAELLKQLMDSGIVYENYVGISHTELYQKYVECDIVSFVSTGEGFGVPIIEAQACGRPLITSNISPLCDVAGEGACLVDPLDIKQIRKGLERIISDEDYREKIVKAGLLNSKRYSPQVVAREYYNLYEGVLGE